MSGPVKGRVVFPTEDTLRHLQPSDVTLSRRQLRQRLRRERERPSVIVHDDSVDSTKQSLTNRELGQRRRRDRKHAASLNHLTTKMNAVAGQITFPRRGEAGGKPALDF